MRKQVAGHSGGLASCRGLVLSSLERSSAVLRERSRLAETHAVQFRPRTAAREREFGQWRRHVFTLSVLQTQTLRFCGNIARQGRRWFEAEVLNWWGPRDPRVFLIMKLRRLYLNRFIENSSSPVYSCCLERILLFRPKGLISVHEQQQGIISHFN